MDNVYKIVFSSVSDGHRDSRLPCVLKCSISLSFFPLLISDYCFVLDQEGIRKQEKGYVKGNHGSRDSRGDTVAQKARNEGTGHKAGSCDPHGPSCCLPIASTSGCSLMR